MSKQSLLISIKNQTLVLCVDDNPVKQYSISTALKGTGCDKNSFQTPLGKHIIRAKIGQGNPMNMVFIGRRATGKIYSSDFARQQPNRDWVLSRILWLSGCEVGLNRLGQVDTMQRYIYIHGTPNSEPMGKPLSHGCIRMRNEDVIDLFSLVNVGMQVNIQP